MKIYIPLRLILGIWFILMTSNAHADELRPAYIELNQISDEEWNILWKASAQSPLVNGEVIIADNCTISAAPVRKLELTNQITRFSMRCDDELYGKSIGLRGLEYSNSDALVRISALNSEVQTLRLTPNANIAVIEAPTQGIITNVASSYMALGFDHILEGYDHLLFVLALVLLIPGFKRVAWTITAFTLAHSITLIGTTLGYLALPSQPVETVIALSIMFLALEIVRASNNDGKQPRLSERYPWVIAFLFGLLHGFGFAGALAEIGLPQNDAPLALLTFNLGVELGQLLIVSIGYVILQIIAKYIPKISQRLKMTLAYAIGIIATYWFLERLFS